MFGIPLLEQYIHYPSAFVTRDAVVKGLGRGRQRVKTEVLTGDLCHLLAVSTVLLGSQYTKDLRSWQSDLWIYDNKKRDFFRDAQELPRSAVIRRKTS